jgi:hypothetical protein
MPTHYLACDLGADSGRVMLGALNDGKIAPQDSTQWDAAATRFEKLVS